MFPAENRRKVRVGVVYEGEVKIVSFDPEDPDSLEQAEKQLEDFVTLEEGQKLHVSIKGSRLEVKKIKKVR